MKDGSLSISSSLIIEGKIWNDLLPSRWGWRRKPSIVGQKQLCQSWACWSNGLHSVFLQICMHAGFARAPSIPNMEGEK
jgi:hypothetical protein